MAVELTNISFTKTIDGTPVNWLLANLDDDITIEHSITCRTFAINSSDAPWVMNNDNGFIDTVIGTSVWITGGDFSKFNVGDIVLIGNYPGSGTFVQYAIIITKQGNSAIELDWDPVGWGSNTMGTDDVFSVARPITALSYKWNFIKNSEAVNFFSKIDGSVQCATITGLNPQAGGTNKPMQFLGQKPYQIGSIEVDEVGLDNDVNNSPVYASKFKIRHKTKLVNIVTADTLADFQAGIAPEEFFNLECLKSVFNFEARYDLLDPNNPQTLQVESILGNTGWINEKFNANPTNYSIDNLQYAYIASGGVVTPISGVELSTVRKTKFYFDILNTTDNPFVAGQTKLVLNFKKVPGDAGEYTANARDYKHNFCHEQATLTCQAVPTAINGDNYTDLAVKSLQGLKAFYVSPSKITVTGNFEFDQLGIDVFEESDIPAYIFLCSIKNHLLNGAVSDAVTLKVDANEIYYQTFYPNLIEMDSKLIPHDCANYTDAFLDRDKFTEDEIVAYTHVHLNRDPAVYSVEFIKYTTILKIVNTVSGDEFTVETKSINLPSNPTLSVSPFFNILQNRPFHIPLTEIRKPIVAKNFAGLGTNDYVFAYPFLNRWEYWVSLVNANGAFYNNAEPNNGQNHDWQHYIGNDWTARYVFELNTKINDVPATYSDFLDFNIFDRNLTGENTTCVINTYDPDTLTPLVDGFGTKYLLGYKNTLVEAEFTNLIDYFTFGGVTVVLGIETKEIGGYYGKRRISTKYNPDSDTWFIPLAGETKAKLEYINTSVFPIVDMGKVKVSALVDFNQLNLSVSDYKITARLYGEFDTQTGGGILEYGQNYLGSQDFGLIPVNPVDEETEVLPPATLDCNSDYVWRVLADVGSSDPLKNDTTNFIEWYEKTGVASAKVYLCKCDGTKIDLTALSTYGTPYDFGFNIMPNLNYNTNGEKAIGYHIEWKKVLTVIGEGIYYLQFEATTLFGSITIKKTPSYCLKQYTVARADGTVRIEYYLNGVIGKTENDKKVRDYLKSNWYNMHRFDGYFFYQNSQYKVNEIQYQNGFIDEVEHGQTPEYLMKIKPIPFFKHDILRTDILMSNRILVTDYNTKNIDNYYQKEVKKNGNYEPIVHPMQRQIAGVEIKFKQAFNNLNKYIS